MASAQKKAEDEGRTLVWIDEAAFYLLPALVRTWAPVGEPPILRAPCSYDHLSAISAITPNGQLLLHVQEEAYHGAEVVRFLRHVLRHIDGKLLMSGRELLTINEQETIRNAQVQRENLDTDLRG